MMTAIETMPTVEKLIEDASAGADLNIGRIISEAFRMSGVHCPHCHYPQNAQDYENLLWSYINARKREHRARIRYEHLDCRFAHLRLNDSEAYAAYWKCMQEVAELKKLMKPMRPCARCRVRFNPTSRVRHGLKRSPEIKEFLSDV
jgi:hypothetical protein